MEYLHPESLVSPSWLAEHLQDPDLRVVDIRFAMRSDANGQFKASSGREEYTAAHVPGAVFVDLMGDLADPDAPLEILSAERFAALMGRLGIGNESTVVVYDGSGGIWAARLWWALRYYGHDDVRLLDGGFARWRGDGHSVEAGVIQPVQARFQTHVSPALRVTQNEVLAAISDDDICIVDALPEALFLGGAKPAPGYRAGHIPGACNLPAQQNLDPETFSLLSATELEERYTRAGVQRDQKVITYCGGGVFAAFTFFVLHLMGHENVALYDASWREWGADPELPVETGPAKSSG